MRHVLILAAILLVGCNSNDSYYVSDRCERQKLFKECLERLPPPAATHYADYDEVVAQCDAVALYQTVRLRIKTDESNTCIVPKY